MKICFLQIVSEFNFYDNVTFVYLLSPFFLITGCWWNILQLNIPASSECGPKAQVHLQNKTLKEEVEVGSSHSSSWLLKPMQIHKLQAPNLAVISRLIHSISRNILYLQSYCNSEFRWKFEWKLTTDAM